jgi:uncharacterized protein YdeI (YjbR/CyaY-like superfamily)
VAKSSSSKRAARISRAPKGPKPQFFASPAEFRAWLEAHHATADEIVVGFYRKALPEATLTWAQAVDQALCFGWIDGIRRRWDERRYSNRFTPRRKGSTWSAINIRRVGELSAEGLMHAAGLAAFERRSDAKSAIYSYEQRHRATLDPSLQKQFERHRAAWAFFQAQAPSYRQLVTYWIARAKQPETRQRRLERAIAASARRKRL